jgi:hypothetical protein
MPITVEVDQAIESGKPFEVTLSVDDGEPKGTFKMTLTVKGLARKFALQLGTLPKTPLALSHVVKVLDQNTWTVLDWGSGSVGDPLVVKVAEKAPGTRKGSDSAAIVP